MNITVFGGSQPQPGSQAYQEAYHLGWLLGQAGHTVFTGGYMGTMEAVSRGTAEGGGHVIGVTCQEIENWRQTGPNPWVQKELRVPTFRERLHILIDSCEAALALPGGPGTLTEISLTWNQLIVQSIPIKPLILIGAPWLAVFQQMFTSLDSYVPAHQRQYLTFAPDIDSALIALDGQLGRGVKSN